ncbi:MAG: VWA domain-containing protein [Vicinamibacterales bacterium]
MTRLITRPAILALAAIFLAGPASPSADGVPAPRAPRSRSTQQGATTTTVEVVVLDRDGKAVGDLRPSDFTVTIDRRPRRVVSVRHVTRGPGALSEAAVRQATAGRAITFAAEPSRNVLVVVDQATLTRGRERAVVQAAGAFLDRLGLDDRVGVVRVPLRSQALLTLTTERPEAREALRTVAGQATPALDLAPGAVAAEPPDKSAGVIDPDRVADPERPVTDKIAPQEIEGRPGEAAEGQVAGTLAQIEDLLRGLDSIRGRKVVALFSAGIAGASPAALERTALAAAMSHTVIHAFRIEGGNEGDPRLAPDPGALERLALMTGGGFASLGRNPERAIDRALSALSSCYVLTIEAEPQDLEEGRHAALGVRVSRERTTVRAASRMVSMDDPGDVVPDPPALTPPREPASAGKDRPDAVRSKPSSAASAAEHAAREAELKLAMARLLDYVNGYQRQYSALVAEEEYWQQDKNDRRTLRSDLLLIKPANEEEDWVLFRDVFEVDGDLVRDRDERLKKLFLDRSPEAQSQLQQILAESSRFNIGQVIRNINVPFFALKFLSPANMARFEFRLAGRQEVAGIDAWRVEYTETASPTVVRNQADRSDVPAKGWFMVDPLTGAILETRMDLLIGEARGEYVVRFRRDTSLGLWVPSEMRETYLIRPVEQRTALLGRVGTSTTTYRGDWTTFAEARATYSKFRRFQVKTEERIVIPK